MSDASVDVALLTERRYESTFAAADDWYLSNILEDDRLLQAALARHGIRSVRVDWSRPDVDWSAFRGAIFRTTWDYFDRPAEFAAWLARIETQTLLCNTAALVRWNMDKHYLADLEARGVAVVPSQFLERGMHTSLAELLHANDWNEAVIKPCVSGAARHTYRLNRANAADIDALIAPLRADESFLVQPFQNRIQTEGEDSLMLFAGRFGHAVRKVPKSGDFRVQDDHGGRVHPHDPTPAQIALAEAALAACPSPPAYARIDMITDNTGRFAIMELELIEPELWLRRHPPSAIAMADAIAFEMA